MGRSATAPSGSPSTGHQATSLLSSETDGSGRARRRLRRNPRRGARGSGRRQPTERADRDRPGRVPAGPDPRCPIPRGPHAAQRRPATHRRPRRDRRTGPRTRPCDGGSGASMPLARRGRGRTRSGGPADRHERSRRDERPGGRGTSDAACPGQDPMRSRSRGWRRRWRAAPRGDGSAVTSDATRATPRSLPRGSPS